jgi:DNA repair ATPase RecN
MALTVRVRNFQSIEDATVVIDGFTVVTGANNSGKTALQRAVRGVFTNPPAGALVRHGAKYLSVEITFPDGQTVIWEKGSKVNRYIVNGKTLSGVGRGGVPDEVKALGVHEIKAGSDKIWPQIAQQFVGQVFLLDRPGSMLAEAVADVEKVGQLSSALKLAERDRRSALSSLKVRRKDEQELKTEVESYKGLDDVDSKVSAVETLLTEAEQAELEATQLGALLERLQQARDEVDLLIGIEDVSVPPASLAQEAQQTRDEVTTLQGLRDKMGRLQRAITRWEAVVKAAQTTTLDTDDSAVQGVRNALAFFTKLRDDMARERKTVESLKDKLDEQQGYLDAQDLLVDEVLAEMGACPTCHQRVGEHHEHEMA